MAEHVSEPLHVFESSHCCAVWQAVVPAVPFEPLLPLEPPLPVVPPLALVPLEPPLALLPPLPPVPAEPALPPDWFGANWRSSLPQATIGIPPSRRSSN